MISERRGGVARRGATTVDGELGADISGTFDKHFTSSNAFDGVGKIIIDKGARDGRDKRCDNGRFDGSGATFEEASDKTFDFAAERGNGFLERAGGIKIFVAKLVFGSKEDAIRRIINSVIEGEFFTREDGGETR